MKGVHQVQVAVAQLYINEHQSHNTCFIQLRTQKRPCELNEDDKVNPSMDCEALGDGRPKRCVMSSEVEKGEEGLGIEMRGKC